MKRLHHLYVYAFIVLVPILLLLYLGSVEADVYAASPRQQPASLTVYTVGNGTVDKDPDQGSYEYGDVVTLTVTADPGWTFIEWSGDLAGSDNPETLIMDGDKTVTATLTQDEYSLTVTEVGSGTVDVDPVGPYTYGQVLTLTATADPGWTFDSWSGGGLSGNSSPVTLTMTGDTAVTAIFTQDEYTLTVGVSPIGSGTVDKDPDQATYYYGEVVTLTATADPGWTFIEWSGDLTGSDNPETLIMDGDKTVTATLRNLSDINIWYGSHQVFGHIGIPQQWVNILGNVSDPDGVASLTYSLNGGPESSLSIGPDTRRLVADGDFNVDIAYEDLDPGLNQVVITATDNLNHQTVETVTVEYVSGNVWPETYSIDWSSVITIPSVAQIVDGLWTLEADSIRPVVVGYDRLIAIGDMDWDDYEVTVPITIHDMSGNGGTGILMRWNGHTDDPVSGWQPKSGWNPLGAIGWFRYNRLEFWGNDDEIIATNYSRIPATGVPYIFKMRVETIPGEGGLYSLRVWEYGQPEPSEWDLIAQEELSDPQNGSMMLIVHLWDVSFGDVTITPGPFPPIISNIQVTPTETSATVTWTTSKPATSTVSYGPSPAYENGSVTDNTLVTEHAITLTDLFQGTLYHYQISSADESGNVASSTDLTFRTAGVASSIVSDDFNTCGLNTGLWEFIDPVGDATQAVMGTFTEDAWLSISVPAGTDHDIWEGGNFAPRIMQPANDVDFEIKVKFESPLTQTYQMQGVLVEQDSDDFLRFEFHSKDSDTMLYAAIFEPDPDPSQILRWIVKCDKRISDTNVAPLYMRVRRQGNQWTQSYSYDGVDWTTPVTFTHPLTVTAAGTYAGNASGASSPAHTAYIDYFFNSASPIVSEDGDRNTLTFDLVGSGTVVKDPDQASYSCGQVVTLTATADPGWSFSGWSGDLAGSTNPATLVMTGSRVVTATFTVNAPENQIFLPIITVQYSP